MARESAEERAARHAEEGFENVTQPGMAVAKPQKFTGVHGEVVATATDLREMDIDQLVQKFGYVEASDALKSDQFGPILENKDELVGKRCIFVHWNFYQGDFGPFVSVWVLTDDNRRFIVNDGSTGLFQQLASYTEEKGIDSMLVAPHGLRRSDYKYTDDKGNERPASTYYVDTKL